MGKELDLSAVPEYDEWIPLTMEVIGKRDVVRKKDGKKFTVLVVKSADGTEVSLFEWGLKTEGGKIHVIKRHLNAALDEAHKGIRRSTGQPASLA